MVWRNDGAEQSGVEVAVQVFLIVFGGVAWSEEGCSDGEFVNEFLAQPGAHERAEAWCGPECALFAQALGIVPKEPAECMREDV
jgi:hypothetical protein